MSSMCAKTGRSPLVYVRNNVEANATLTIARGFHVSLVVIVIVKIADYHLKNGRTAARSKIRKSVKRLDHGGLILLAQAVVKRQA